jgi:hypothetical protein
MNLITSAPLSSYYRHHHHYHHRDGRHLSTLHSRRRHLDDLFLISVYVSQIKLLIYFRFC